ncbi:MAG: peptidylprolyl isomerase [Lachnospiraceae bacterium]
MKPMGKRIRVLGLAAIMGTTMLTGCGELKKDDVVATVGDSKITGSVANFYTRFQQAQYETYYAQMMGGADTMWSQKTNGKKTYEDDVKKTALEGLEQMYILEDHMKDYEVTISDEEKAKIEKTANKFIKDNELKAKEATSADPETVGKILTLMTIQQKMSKAMTAEVNKEVDDKEAAQKSMQYVTFPYSTADESGAATALDDAGKAEVKKKAEAFAVGGKDAADFAAFAKEQKMEAQTATFDAKSTSPDSALVQAADGLAANETTGVVETENGCYVARVTSLLDRAATDKKKEAIVSERQQVEFDKIYKGFKKKTDISVNKKNWNKIDFEKQGITVKKVEDKPYTD